LTERYRADLEPDETPEEQTVKKVRGRPFQPGNPGRPVGAKNKTTRLLEQLVGNEAEKLVRKGIDRALGGDGRCLQLFLDRLLPRRNGRPVDFTLPAVTNMRDVVAAMAAITNAVNDGSLTAEEAGQLVKFLDGYTKVLGVHDHAARLEALELQMKKRHER
jgi:hypothetical protein